MFPPDPNQDRRPHYNPESDPASRTPAHLGHGMLSGLSPQEQEHTAHVNPEFDAMITREWLNPLEGEAMFETLLDYFHSED